MKSTAKLLASVNILILLAACGGGGGGVKPTPITMQSPPAEMPVTPEQTAFSQTQAQNTDVLIESTEILLDLFQQSNDPLFGSVAQFWSVGLPSVVGIDTTYDGDRFTLDINRQSGAPTTLDTTNDYVVNAVDISPPENLVTNRPAVEGYIVSVDATVTDFEITVAGVSVEWENTDFTDYLAGGYWIHVDLFAIAAEIGAFVDGPEIDGIPQMPLSGTATYTGRAAGVYFTEHGTDTQYPAGTGELGEYAGRLELVADFGANTISGNVDNIGLSSDLGQDSLSGYGLMLGSAPIDQNGFYSGDNVRLTNPDVNIISTSGSWAGRFSTIDDNSGNPRATAGTHAGSASTSGGSQAVFVGAHYGATERFQ